MSCLFDMTSPKVPTQNSFDQTIHPHRKSLVCQRFEKGLLYFVGDGQNI